MLAVDGKTLRGARRPDGAQAKLISVYEHRHRLVLVQVGVVDGDEIAAFATALAALPDLRGVVLTADALRCQRQHAHWLHDRGGHYLFTVKASQPILRRALAAGTWRRDRGQGRTESRSIKVLDLAGHPARALFPHATGRSRSSGPVGARRPDTAPARSCTRSPRWITGPPTPACSPPGSAGTGRSRTPFITSAMSPRVRTPPGSGPAPGPR